MSVYVCVCLRGRGTFVKVPLDPENFKHKPQFLRFMLTVFGFGRFYKSVQENIVFGVKGDFYKSPPCKNIPKIIILLL